MTTFAISRLKCDYMDIKKNPRPYILAEPLPSNILEWHYVIKGPEDTPYFGGIYHGILKFPTEYPFKPPAIYILTPNGRFKTNVPLCMSISSFHPETWNPSWSVGSILAGFLSFMVENKETTGAIDKNQYERKIYAKKSLLFNLKNSEFRELFPEICQDIKNHIIINDNYKIELNNTNNNNKNNTIKFIDKNIDINNMMAYCNHQNNNEQKHQQQYSYQSSLILIIGMVLFCLTVNFVLKQIKE